MAIEDVGKLSYSGKVTPIEEQERHVDDGTVLRGIHSRIGKSLGDSIEKTLTSITGIVYESSQTVNNTSYVSLDGDPCTYEGFTWGFGGNIDFLFVRIIEPVTAGQTPAVWITFDGTTDRIRLYGTGDFCIVPLHDYQTATDPGANGSTKLKIKAVGASNYAKVEFLAIQDNT